MLISHKHKWIFIHVPKNAGTTATQVLESYADIMGAEYKELEDNVPPKNDIIDLNFYQHDTASVIKEKLKDQEFNYDDYFKFGIVRNPWERAVSKWNYWQKLVRQGTTIQYFHYVVNRYKNFKDWVVGCGADGNSILQVDYLYESRVCHPESLRTMSTNVKRSKDWIHSTKNSKSDYITPLVDRVIHTENYEQELSNVFDEISENCGQKILEWSYEKISEKVNKTKHKHYTEYYDDETRSIIEEKFAKDIECFGYEFGE
tara:strand:- start:260 stop:1036 length:777 start_codon:yes stop_codon:yes gene_type:complete